MPKTKSNEPIEIRPVPPSVVQPVENAAPPVLAPAPPESPLVKEPEPKKKG